MSPTLRGSTWIQREIDATKGIIHGKRSVALLDLSRLLPKSSGVIGESRLVIVVYGLKAQVTYPSLGLRQAE